MRRTIPEPRSWLVFLLAATAYHVGAGDAEAQSAGLVQPIHLDVTRDTWVSEVGREADGNNGAAPRLKFKSIQEMALLDVDAAPLRGRTIRSASLHLRKAADERLWRVTGVASGRSGSRGPAATTRSSRAARRSAIAGILTSPGRSAVGICAM